MGEKGFDFRSTHLGGVAFVVEKDLSLRPMDIGFFGAAGVVFQAGGIARLVQKFPGFGWGCVSHFNLFS